MESLAVLPESKLQNTCKSYTFICFFIVDPADLHMAGTSANLKTWILNALLKSFLYLLCSLEGYKQPALTMPVL